ncbi:hypothetical protein [Brevundimonas sp.]|uniref:hypothetical protein n=1 Tax=Brevundimonas sp. TaxID=1871086 RepID=UPI0027379D6B|nr:hypothetical protein [Brevundimonas sp.]MDP3802589.1 hypothetical protein [Brevundimonas sp.]
MPHQNSASSDAAAQNSATDSGSPRNIPTDQDLRPEPTSYAAREGDMSSVAPPAAGEVADYQDEGEALEGEPVQQGATNTNRPDRTEALDGQGPKTRAANKDIVRGRM